MSRRSALCLLFISIRLSNKVYRLPVTPSPSFPDGHNSMESMDVWHFVGKFVWIGWLIISQGWTSAYAQQDTLALPSIEVSASKKGSRPGEIRLFDSTSMSTQNWCRAGDRLFFEGILDIQQYGPAALAGLSIRGMGPQRSLVTLNGLPVQSAFNGQADLNLLPLNFFSEATLSQRQQGLSTGMGNLGGTLALTSEGQSSQGWQLGIGTSANTNQQYQHQAAIGWGNDQWSIRNQGLWVHGPHRFRYELDGTAGHQRVPQQLRSYYTEVKYSPEDHQQLLAWYWNQSSDRRLPTAVGTNRPPPQQTDQTEIAAFQYQAQQQDGWQWEGQAAWQREDLHYKDEQSQIDATYRANQWRFSASAKQFWDNGMEGDLQLTYVGIRGEAVNTGGQQRRDHGIISARYRLPIGPLFAETKWSPSLLDGKVGPWSAELLVEWPKGPMQIWLLGARNYRLPTFNDLYWEPGGNPLLNEEQSKKAELGVSWRKGTFQVQAQGYHQRVKDWIQWVPQGVLWSPQNIRDVSSWGVCGDMDYKWSDSKWHYRLGFQGEWLQIRDVSSGSQLRYTPHLKMAPNMSIAQDSWEFVWLAKYTGLRYARAGEQGRLSAFFVHTLTVRYQWPFKVFSGNIQLKIHNLFNARYEVIQRYPMPLRFFELSGHFSFE